MRLSLQRDDALDVLYAEPVARALVLRRKLLNDRSLSESHIILIGREDLVGILLRGLLDHREEGTFHLLAVDDKGSAENLMTAVLRVDLCEAEDLRVRQRAPVLLLQSMQVFYFLRAQGQSFLLVVFLQIFHMLDGLRLDVDRKDALVEAAVHTLQHRVVVGILAGYGEIFLDAADALEAHILGNLYGIGRPRGHHLASRAYEPSVELVCIQQRCLAVKPG